MRTADLGALMLRAEAGRCPRWLCRSDGAALLYPSAVHAISGEPGTGKSWVALAALVEVIEAGGRAVLVDFESSPAATAARLGVLGADPDRVSERLVYVQPIGGVGLVEVDRLRGLAGGAAVVVIDSVAEAMAHQGLDENAAGDVTRWFEVLPRPLARDGAAVVLVDHVTKAGDGRGRWARGSGAKLAALDGAAFGLQLGHPFSRHGSGFAELVVAKDRDGCVGPVGEVVAEVAFEVAAGGEQLRVRFDPPGRLGDTATSDRLEPRDVADRLAADGGVWSSVAMSRESLDIGREASAQVLRQAVAAGLITEEPGVHGTRVYRLTDPNADRRPSGPDP